MSSPAYYLSIGYFCACLCECSFKWLGGFTSFYVFLLNFVFLVDVFLVLVQFYVFFVEYFVFVFGF